MGAFTAFCLIAAVVVGAYGTALALVGTRVNILPLQLYSLISETGSDFAAAAALSLILLAFCSAGRHGPAFPVPLDAPSYVAYQSSDILYVSRLRRTMPVIKPISDLRNRARDIARLCHEGDEPVFITRNGESDLVVMSQAHYDRLQAVVELYRRLGEAEHQAARGAKGIGHREMMRRLRARLP